MCRLRRRRCWRRAGSVRSPPPPPGASSPPPPPPRTNRRQTTAISRWSIIQMIDLSLFLRKGNAESTHNQCSGSGMFIPYPKFPVPDPGSMVKKIPDPDPQQIFLVFLTQKLFLSSRIYDPGCSSRIWILIFTHPGSWIQWSKGTGSRIRIRNTVHINDFFGLKSPNPCPNIWEKASYSVLLNAFPRMTPILHFIDCTISMPVKMILIIFHVLF